METTVDWAGGVRFIARTRGHEVVCDQPEDNGGTDAGMSPPEFLLASLGTCAASYAAEYLRARKLPQEGPRVRVRAEKASQPSRLSRFSVSVELPPLDDPRHIEGVERAVKRCLIHNTLLHAPQIDVAIEAPVTMEAGAAG